MSTLHDELPYIHEIVLQSDNANTYQNHFLTLGILLLNIKWCNQIYISQFIHSETQDGKTILDAHFAVSARHLDIYMKLWICNGVRRIQTPKGLAFGLSSNHGVQNSMVQLVHIDHEKLESLKKRLMPLHNQCKEYFSRINSTYFQTPTEEQKQSVLDFINGKEDLSMTTSFRAQAFTGIRNHVCFQ